MNREVPDLQSCASDDLLAADGAVDTTAAPVRRQYLQIKRRYPDTILFFRLGDFYETFEQDAEIAASVLDIMLTGRDLGKGVRVPMAGIPHHAADGYIARLVNAGHKVAVCEQIGGAERSRGLIDRDVTHVVTPGTVTDPSMLDSRRNQYVVSVYIDGSRGGIAFADLSTGEFATTQLVAGNPAELREKVGREVLRLGAAEIVLPTAGHNQMNVEAADWLPEGPALSAVDGWAWRFESAQTRLLQHFDVESLDGFGLSGMRAAVQSAGGLLAYLENTQRSRLSQLTSLRTYSPDGFMVLDAQARRNLELTESARGEKRHSLITVLDETRTPMGARLLRRWLGQPLLDLGAIKKRQDVIQHYSDHTVARSETRRYLGRIADIERLTNRALTGTVSPRELVALRQSLQAFCHLAAEHREPSCIHIGPIVIEQCGKVLKFLNEALPDESPTNVGSGNTIRPGFSPELDAHDRHVREAREWIAGLEREERARTGIRTLKVGYNRASGYFIEIPANALAALERDRDPKSNGQGAVPADYVIRQSLANASRFVTAQLKEREARILGAQEALAQMESDVFHRIESEVAAHANWLRDAAELVAQIDLLSALAEIAISRGYVRPTVDNSLVIDIRGGRHPTLEVLLPAGEFVANDALLNDHSQTITILTGPNMAGKSSWLRQVSLIVLLAQIGSFVPASAARIGLVDRIFTRIGAQDDIASGQSTFMVEMLETANILHHATPRSLLLLDEIGRGTSTWDGLAIARAVVEFIHNSPKLGCRTLFATHFHELTAVADLLPGVTCARMDVLEDGDRIVFLHHVVPGAADRSYGIHVAELAGIPRALTRRARDILADLEHGPGANAVRERRRAVGRPASENMSMQLTLFAPPSPLVNAVRELDVESLSPLEALTKLYELRQLAGDEPSLES